MNTVFGREPVLWLALIQAGLAMGIGFGLKLTTEQMAMILTFTGAVLAFIARSTVTPQAPASAKDITTYIEKADPSIIDKSAAKEVTHAIDKAAATKAVVIGLVLGLLGVPAVGLAAPATWSLQRVSLGLDAKAAIIDQTERTTVFLPGAYLSWSATSGLSLAGTIERDFSGDRTIGRAGGRFLIARMGDGGQLAAGASLVGYSGEGWSVAEPTSWEASLHGAYPIWESAGRTVAWGILGASFDPENDVQMYRLGLRWQAIGGSE